MIYTFDYQILSLTKANIDVVDIDYQMTSWLNVIYKENNNIKIITNDVRKTDVSKYNKIIANLPYNVTTELIVFLLNFATNAKKLVLMCQSETFEHFFQTSGSEYGPTSVLIHLLGNIKKEVVVKAGSFVPAPKCNSTVFSIQISEDANFNQATNVYKFAKALFVNRRKTILNNLTLYLKNKENALLALTKLSINPQTRPENISPEQYLNLFKNLSY